jgi:hypothetical protein
MSPNLFREIALHPALRLLPPMMTSPEAEAMVIAICLQESRLDKRRQIGRQEGTFGPARGYAQFEWIGTKEVLRHPASQRFAVALCRTLDVEPDAGVVHAAMEFQDVLMAGFARLYLWTLPDRLSRRDETDRAWGQYLRRWAPGAPHPETWPELYALAWEVTTR